MIKNPPASVGDTRDEGLIPGLGTLPELRSKWQPTLVFLPGKSHGQRSLACYIPWGHKRVRHNLVTNNNKLLVLKINVCSVYVCVLSHSVVKKSKLLTGDYQQSTD